MWIRLEPARGRRSSLIFWTFNLNPDFNVIRCKLTQFPERRHKCKAKLRTALDQTVDTKMGLQDGSG